MLCKIYNKLLSSFLLVFFLTASGYTQQTWSSAGLEGGIIKSLFVRSDGVVYAGTQRGVYLSVDFGTSWTKGTNNVYQYGINAVIVVGNMVFAAADNGGFFVSYDNGYNFSQLNSGYNINTLCKIDQVIYAGLGYSITNSAIVYSTNYGVNWSQSNLPGSTVVNDIVTDDVALYAATNNGVYLAYHPGSSWIKYDTGIPANTKVFSLKKAGFIILAATDKGIYRSTDNGGTWNEANNGLNINLPFLAVTTQGTNAYTCQFGKAVYRSSNFGDEWIPVYTGLTDFMLYKFAVYNTYLFAASAGGGMYVTVDNGGTWFPKNSGLNVHTIYALHSVGNVMYAGTHGGGVYRSLNLGANWSPRNDMLGNSIVFSFTDAGNFIYAGTFGGIFRNNGSGVWETMNNGLNDSVVFALNYNGANLFAGTQSGGIYRSSNFGNFWTKLSGIVFNDTVYALANIGTEVFASTKRNGFVKSTDQGDTWQIINNGFTSIPYSLSLAVKGSNVYSSVFYGSPKTGIFKSADSGNSWGWISNPVSSASYFVHTYLNSIFASYYGNNGGEIRVTTNEGVNWSLITPFQPLWGTNCDVRCIKVFSDYVYAGTSGKSLWRIPVSSVISVNNISENIPDNFKLYPNYPNPFNAGTVIRFQLSVNSLVTIKVYDVQGRELKTLVNDRLNAGSYETTFDGAELNSGVYFFRMIANGQSVNFGETRKMIVLK